MENNTSDDHFMGKLPKNLCTGNGKATNESKMDKKIGMESSAELSDTGNCKIEIAADDSGDICGTSTQQLTDINIMEMPVAQLRDPQEFDADLANNNSIAASVEMPVGSETSSDNCTQLHENVSEVTEDFPIGDYFHGYFQKCDDKALNSVAHFTTQDDAKSLVIQKEGNVLSEASPPHALQEEPQDPSDIEEGIPKGNRKLNKDLEYNTSNFLAAEKSCIASENCAQVLVDMLTFASLQDNTKSTTESEHNENKVTDASLSKIPGESQNATEVKNVTSKCTNFNKNSENLSSDSEILELPGINTQYLSDTDNFEEESAADDIDIFCAVSSLLWNANNMKLPDADQIGNELGFVVNETALPKFKLITPDLQENTTKAPVNQEVQNKIYIETVPQMEPNVFFDPLTNAWKLKGNEKVYENIPLRTHYLGSSNNSGGGNVIYIGENVHSKSELDSSQNEVPETGNEIIDTKTTGAPPPRVPSETDKLPRAEYPKVEKKPENSKSILKKPDGDNCILLMNVPDNIMDAIFQDEATQHATKCGMYQGNKNPTHTECGDRKMSEETQTSSKESQLMTVEFQIPEKGNEHETSTGAIPKYRNVSLQFTFADGYEIAQFQKTVTANKTDAK